MKTKMAFLVTVIATFLGLCSPAATAATPPSDLIIVGLKMTPAKPNPGDQVQFTMTVENLGGATIPGQQLSGAFFVNGIKSTWSTGNGNTASLPQYGYRDLVADGGPFGSAYYTWGDYTQTVMAVINDTNIIYESNTGNNSYSQTFQAAPPADFIIVDLKMTPANPNPGDNVIFTMTVENIGGATVAGQQLSGAFYVNGIKSTWSTGNGNTAPLPQYGYRDLVADGGPFNNNSANYTWGNYTQTVMAVVNDANRIAESNTNNNSYSQTFQAAPPPDFIIVGLKMNPPNPVPGQNVIFTMTVENIGGATVAGQQLSGAFYVNGIKSTWSSGNGNTASLPQYGYRDLVADGGPFNNNSANYTWGNYTQTVMAVVNDANRIAESNTGNNSYSHTFQERKSFYGINGHFDYPLSNADLLKMLKGLGVTNYRINTGTSSDTIAKAVSIASYLIANGIQVLPVLDCGIFGNTGDENGAYSAAYNMAVQMVLAFQGLGITVYEVGNELDRQPEIFPHTGYPGNQTVDYNNAGMPTYRGTVRGLIDGVHAAQWNAQAGIDFVGADIAAADMLWNGTQPDGSTGHLTARWDITMWHDYEVNLPIFNIGVDGGGQANPPLNIPEYAKRYNNNPFWLTEFNANHEDPQAQKVTYLNSVLPDLYNNRINDNIDAIFIYQLDGDYGLLVDDKATPFTFYPYFYTYQSFISTHPE